MTTFAPDRSMRRASVRQLAQRGMSHRAIAAQLGVGKDTVRRDLAQLAHGGAPDTGALRHDPAHGDAPADAPPPAPTAPDHAPAPPPAAHPAQPDAPPAAQQLALPGAHPSAIRAIEALRAINPDTMRHHPRQTRDTHATIRATMARATSLLAHLGACDPIQAQQLRFLAGQLCAIADAGDTQ